MSTPIKLWILNGHIYQFIHKPVVVRYRNTTKMRLLNAHTMILEEFPNAEAAPKYAILSHTWGKEEVALQSLHDETKIENCCRQAMERDLHYVWVDTCCIDKKDPTELSEAINSMFRWYQKSAVCYIYLDDLEADEEGNVQSSILAASRWFTRGWTLQEMLAPERVVFFDRRWQEFGKCIWREPGALWHSGSIGVLPHITGIPESVLTRHRPMHTVTAAEKLSWAARRETTRKEDMAYCLLGILDVNMPLLYGEGTKAFIRLQEEYIRQHNDPSLLAWGFGVPCPDTVQLHAGERNLAQSPSAFAGFSSVHPKNNSKPSVPTFEKNIVPFTFWRTNNGIEIELLLLTHNDDIKFACFGSDRNFYASYRKPYGPLHSLFPRRVNRQKNDGWDRTVVAVPLVYCATSSLNGFEVYERALLWPPFLISEDWCWDASWKRVCLRARSTPSSTEESGYRRFLLDIREWTKNGFSLAAVYPPRHNDYQNGEISVPCNILGASGHEEWHFHFNGPNGLAFELFIEARLRSKSNRNALHLNASIRMKPAAEEDHHLFPQGSTLLNRIVGLNKPAETPRQLHNYKFWRIPGRQLGRPEFDHAILSAPENEIVVEVERLSSIHELTHVTVITLQLELWTERTIVSGTIW
ncbi:hypothetical protein M434DRAFT_10548 [Hypoxylon sp. CO27-5]|nr:hypothetical protein M434DRAFT_10548 [Hypoxylon sp. CO27-5]